MFVYVNGKIVKKEEARISPFDHGFMYGLGLFETFRVYDGHPFLLDDHLERLNEGVRMLNIHLTLTREQVVNIIHELLKANQLRNAYVRFNVSAGLGDVGLQTDAYTNPTIIVYMKDLPRSASLEKACKILNTRRNSPEGEIRLKSHHYLNNILGKREIGQDPQVEGIFLTRDGFVAEGIVSNVFWVKQNTVYTPSIETGILNGITRQFVLKMLSSLGIPYKEGFYSLEDLQTAAEIFLTNSIQEIVPVRQLEERMYPGVEGALTSLLKEKYEQFTHVLWTRYELEERVG
ncbi:4-amino-4-deoxychorismate lyase [Thermolongibacillus altinsuensis]|uniref:4-amino-4-deoxychorismate lyase n=1 Tax=Thermolongibacillus altinsuensis TaxID=575256 RepID=A0A4R1QAQ2_9BACL|nr:aminodeoxychorismate lyase [Thermolongibacillus altinsuensis]TCL46114.1 4-amino-4-deoxychorismate lyase [Thermolongibacillus altinsuensis]